MVLPGVIQGEAMSGREREAAGPQSPRVFPARKSLATGGYRCFEALAHLGSRSWGWIYEHGSVSGLI